MFHKASKWWFISNSFILLDEVSFFGFSFEQNVVIWTPICVQQYNIAYVYPPYDDCHFFVKQRCGWALSILLFFAYTMDKRRWKRKRQTVNTHPMIVISVCASVVCTNGKHCAFVFFFLFIFFCSASSFSSIASSYLVVFSQANIIRSHYFLNDDRIDDVYRLSLYNLLTIPTEISTEIQEYIKKQQHKHAVYLLTTVNEWVYERERSKGIRGK